MLTLRGYYRVLCQSRRDEIKIMLTLRGYYRVLCQSRRDEIIIADWRIVESKPRRGDMILNIKVVQLLSLVPEIRLM